MTLSLFMMVSRPFQTSKGVQLSVKNFIRCFFRYSNVKWVSGGAMVLGKLSVPGVQLIWIIAGQGPVVLSVGAGVVVLNIFLSTTFSLFFLLFS